MLKAGLVGVGAMGRGHLQNYIRMIKENAPVRLVALCDVDEKRFQNYKVDFNLSDVGGTDFNFDSFNLYTDIDEMLKNEQLDMVTLALPTYLHSSMTVKALNAGVNVLCEKPMAPSLEECQAMLDASYKSGKKLMIGHCLRFWGEYTELKKYVDEKTFGEMVSGYFWRGGSTPMWSFENWLQKKECGGGAILDQHVHDVDTVNFTLGLPKAVSTLGKILIKGSNFDTVSTHYFYDDNKVINTQNDWTMHNDPFSMTFRVNFERGSVSYDGSKLIVGDADGNITYPEYDKDNAYYKETLFFADCIINNKPVTVNPPEDSMNTIRMVLSEIISAENNGRITQLV